MTSTLLSPPTPPPAAPPAPPALAAALAAAAPRSGSPSSSTATGAAGPTCSPADDAAAVLDPDLHADLAGAQVWLLSWLPEQGTPLHDHGTSAGAFSVVPGTLTERVVAAGPRTACTRPPPTSPPAGCGTSARTTSTR